MVKNEDTGIDPNKKNKDVFKATAINLVRRNCIKLLIDIHGAKKEHDFDIEIGTRDGTIAKQETVDALIACLKKVGIKSIAINDPFKGGQITQAVHFETSIECIQLEINRNYRSIRKIKNLNRICKALTKFVVEYN